MRPIRILGIAPYESMRGLMLSIAETMPDVAMTAYVGDLEPGASIAEQYTAEDFDVILSRGGTAELIRERSSIPVVEIELSVYDILRAIKLAEGSTRQVAIVGFPAITQSASFLCEVLRCDIALYPIHNSEEARKSLKALSASACDMVLCDMVTSSLAREYGVPAMLITSGTESITSAIRHAVDQATSFLALQNRVQFIESVLEARDSSTLCYDAQGSECYRHLAQSVPAAVLDKARHAAPSVLEDGSRYLTPTVDGKTYALRGQKMVSLGENYAVFTIRETRLNQPMDKYGIRIFDREGAFNSFFNSYYGITQPAIMGELVQKYAESSLPLMVAGELGTGKDQMVRLLYGKSHLSTAPLYVIDCALLKGKGWSFLMESESSPLFDQGITLHFRTVDSLSDAQFHQLFSMIRDLHVARRNRLIFACTLSDTGEMPARAKTLLSWFGALTLTMPTLRTQKQEIPHLASLYVSMLNVRHTREIAGFEPEALTHLCAYDWPANYDQFKRLLQEMVIMTDTPYISAATVDTLLTHEQRFFQPEAPAPKMDFRGKTLEQIELEVVRQTLAEEGGRQGATAARLGISRTTLWRMLQKADAAPAAKDEEG